MAIHASLALHNFWPLVKGGWENVSGHVASVPAVLAALQQHAGGSLEKHQDYADAEDDYDIWSFIEEQTRSAHLPPPERVFTVNHRCNNVSSDLHQFDAPGSYAVWSPSSISAELRALLGAELTPQPVVFSVRSRLSLAPGASAIAWLAVLVLIACVLREA